MFQSSSGRMTHRQVLLSGKGQLLLARIIRIFVRQSPATAVQEFQPAELQYAETSVDVRWFVVPRDAELQLDCTQVLHLLFHRTSPTSSAQCTLALHCMEPFSGRQNVLSSVNMCSCLCMHIWMPNKQAQAKALRANARLKG